ncbi:MAG: DUF4236 domain-containing protein [Bacteroidetes bacterium]|nr:DUF4236 domain-containing protein [Bacteroidota bacterium]
MGLNFRKIFGFGGFRTSLSKGGVGVSWGIPGFRFGVNSQGRKYFTIGFPGLGIYFTKSIGSVNKKNAVEENPERLVDVSENTPKVLRVK